MSKQVFDNYDTSPRRTSVRYSNSATTPSSSSFGGSGVKRTAFDIDKKLSQPVYTTVQSGEHAFNNGFLCRHAHHVINNNNNNHHCLNNISNSNNSPSDNVCSSLDDYYYPSTASLLSELYDRLIRYLKMPSGGNNTKGGLRPLLYKKTRRIPLASLIALAVSWIGLALFCTKTYNGAVEIENLSRDLFAFLIPWIEKFKLGLIILGIFMACVTLAMTLVGYMATQHCHCSYKDKPSSCLCSNFGGRLTCALFWILSYLLNLCWLGILSMTVVMTAAYLAFLPVCLPQAGNEVNFCFNFTLFSLMISGGKDANAVSLILCGGPIDKFCKLSKAVMPWFWGSYFGCIAVLLGLSHFNGSLAANFAHGKHALRYRKLRKVKGSSLSMYKSEEEWTAPPAKCVFENGTSTGHSKSSTKKSLPSVVHTLNVDDDEEMAKQHKCCHREPCNGTISNKSDICV